jgi:hypothetical protein
MEEEQKNTSPACTSDISEIFSTYKTHPTEDEKAEPTLCIQNEILKEVPHLNKTIDRGEEEEVKEIPNYETSFQKKMYILETISQNAIKTLKIIIDGIVRATKIAVWSIAVFGGLFVTALATNTIDRTITILNNTVLSKVGVSVNMSSEVAVVKKEENIPTQERLISNTLTPPT